MAKSRKGFSLGSFLLLLGVVVACTSQLSWGQTGLATISGTVHDPSGASIPGVTVTAINKTTNVTYKAQTNSAGLYHIGALPIGPYTLMAEKQGFNRWQRDLVLEVNQNAGIDFAMEVGSTTTVVQVTGAPPVINTTGSQVGDVLDAQRISMLPLNGRSVGNLFQLTPGVEGDAGAARVNGMKVGSLGITFDGITERDRFGGGMVREQPDIQDIQEFAVDTSGDNARYADPATVTLKSKSGTNQFHGEGFETLLNATGALQARERQQTGVVTIPKEIRNEFGGDIGGPVVLPHIYNGHDKTFFYGSYEGLRNISRADNVPEGGFQQGGGNTVPTLAMWNGDLSNAVDVNNNNAPIIIYNPYTTDANGVRQPFPGNIIPPGMISDIAKKFQAVTQLPTNNNNPFIADNMTNVYPANQKNNNITAKVDENFSDKDRLSVRWSRDTNANTTSGGVFGNPVSPSDGFGTSRENSSVTNVSVDYTRTISNSSLNELLLGVLRTPTSSGTLADFTNEDALFGLPNPFGVNGWPTVCAGCDYCWDGDNRKDEHLTTMHGEDNFTWVKGRHTIEFGGSFSHEQNYVRELQQAQGSDDLGFGWTCQYDPTAQACVTDTGDSFAGMLLGLPDFLSNQFNHGYYYFRQNYLAGYVTDQWRVTPKLTFNLGVRWDRWTPYDEKQNRIDTAPLSTITTPGEMLVITPGSTQITSIPQIPPAVIQSWAARGLTYSTADAFGYPSKLFGQDNHDFGPRLGAAYKINDKTVIRGGYGIFYWPMPLAEILQTSRSNPPLNLRFSNEFLGPGVCGYGNNFSYTINSAPAPGNMLPNATVCTNGIVQISPRAQSMFAYNPTWKDDMMQNWNFSIERQLPTNTTLRISYIGNHGSNLENRISLNSQLPQITYAQTTGLAPPSNKDLLRPNPQWNLPYGYASHSGFSNGDSIQAEVEHKYRSGVDFRWFYVYAHTLTTSDVGGFTSGNLNINGAGSKSSGGGGQIPEVRQLLGQPFLTEQQLNALVYYSSPSVPVQHYGWNGVVDLPFGHGKKFLGNSGRLLDQVVGGWQVAFIGNWTSGYWLSPSTGLVTVGNPNLSSGQRLTFNYGGDQQQLWFRGNLALSNASNVPGGMQALTNLVSANPRNNVVRPFGPDCSASTAGQIDPNRFDGKIGVLLADGTCFSAPSSGFYNPSARGDVLGPSAFGMDSSLYKNFTIHERAKIRFEADFFNVFNHPTNNYPNTSTGLVDLSSGQANSPRFLQFALHVVF